MLTYAFAPVPARCSLLVLRRLSLRNRERSGIRSSMLSPHACVLTCATLPSPHVDRMSAARRATKGCHRLC